MLLTPSQFHDGFHGSPDKCLSLSLENNHISCRANLFNGNNQLNSSGNSSSSSNSNKKQQQEKQQQQQNNTNTTTGFIKYSPTNSLNNSFSSESPSESSSDEDNVNYEDDDDDDDENDDQHYSYSEGEGFSDNESSDDKDRYNDYFSKQYLKKSYHSEEEDVADDDSSDFQDEDAPTSEEEQDILSDDESSDKSSAEEESDSDSDSESLVDESEEEIKKRYQKEWMLDNSNLSLKKSVSTLFASSSYDSESEEDFDSSSGQEGSSSDKDIESYFDDSFLPGSYSINITPPRKENNNCMVSNGAGVATSSEDDDEFYNYRHTRNFDYDSDDEFIDKEKIQREKEQDNNVLIAIRKSVNGTSAKEIKIPYWYGYEDEKHIQVIFEKYIQFLQIDQEAKYTLRGPKPFIGRIHRRAIQYEGETCFTTLDTVKVYRYEIQPLGRPLNIYKSFVLLTCWDDENGLPTKLRKANSLSNKDFWANEAKSLKSQSNRDSKISSFLYCSPIFDTDYSFSHSVDNEKYPVDFLPNTQTITSSRNNNQNTKNFLNIGSGISRLSESHPLLPNLSRGCIVPQRRSSHPSLLLSSHIYSHTLIPQNGFKDKTSNDYS
ncbi:hypothetical protein DICPUDRAFT_95323 [Dictyostelium purpureum]|uniref:Uncharacterized protein n=1 Tax=Dictyostelium purpureum TaxID=5786 RepID=F0ZUY3_DICPU|nr:uncharacterized protein DICPUDRAFT_95323 [Dictyostelium purpureum]EGC32260.1 hypothetical protein DICPUDRAFT_95323 [Dictyostelium purpureum]|eukprot:XP_003291227.1 hypothetical protein DICPUDRAFT_95323 [Dictyostelium purpureum]